MERPLKFESTNEQLEYALKLGYMHACGSEKAGTCETMDALCNALCNLIGDDAFQEFCKTFD